jgi:hypothetical protein
MSDEQPINLQLQLTPQELADAHELLAEGGIAAMAVLGVRTQEEAQRLNRSSQAIRQKLARAEAEATGPTSRRIAGPPAGAGVATALRAVPPPDWGMGCLA